MKFTLFPLAGLCPALIVAPLHAQGPGDPVLSTPGTATWLTETTSTGTRMVFTITGNTVLDWGQFNLNSGNELIFDFVGGSSVANMLNGTSTQTIAGNVTSNGSVGFFSPNASLRVTGTVTAENVTLATMDLNPQSFNSGGSFTMNAGSGATLTVSGTVRATGGNVVLAGQGVRVSAPGKIFATDSIRIAGGSRVQVKPTGPGQRLKAEGGGGWVLHVGQSRASRIEIAAAQEISNNGTLDATAGSRGQQIFLEVGRGGQILHEGQGLLIGRVKTSVRTDEVGFGPGDEMDNAGVMTTSATRFPALTRPGGGNVAKERTLVNDVTVSASADSGRDRKKAASRQVASNGEPLLQRGSFFGMRGGSTSVKKP